MDLDDDNVKLSRMDFAVGLECNNCSCEFFSPDLQSEEIITLKNTIIHDDKEVHIWDALAFIYGITWNSIENYTSESEKRTELLKIRQDLRFCNNCTSLLKDNYISHLKFEHSSDSSSVVQLLKEFLNDQVNSTEKENDVQFLSNELIETVESNIKVDLLEDFVLEDSQEDPFQSEDHTEVKCEPQSPYIDDFSDENTSQQIQSVEFPPLRNLRSNKHLVIKTEKLSPEEILQFTNKIAVKERRGRPRKVRNSKTVKNLDLDHRVKNKIKLHGKSLPGEKISEEAQNRPKPKKKAYKTTGKPSGRGGKQNMTSDEKIKLVMEKYKDKLVCPKITVNGRYVCTVCGKTYKDYDILKFKHWRPMHLLNPDDKVCICDICGKSLRSDKYMKGHKLRTHATEEEKNKFKTKCNLCNAIVFSFDLAQHRIIKHSNLEEKCDECGKVFGNKLSLKAHMEVHNDKLEKCGFCGKMLKEKHLKSHIKNIHSNREKPICCDLCPLRFFTKGRMQRHRLLTHTDLRKYICEECGKTYKYESHLLQHLRCHEEITTKGEGAFTCEFCEGSRFKHSLSLKKHMERIHGMGKRKIYECSVCGKRLSSATILKTHENMHKEVPGFVPRVRTKLPDYIKKPKIAKISTTVDSQPHPVLSTEEIDNNSTINVNITANI